MQGTWWRMEDGGCGFRSFRFRVSGLWEGSACSRTATPHLHQEPGFQESAENRFAQNRISGCQGTEIASGSEEGSYPKLKDFCTTHL